MTEEEVALNEEANPNDPEVREIRDRATEYADRVMAGERPWEDDSDSESPANEDVGETGDADSDPVEVPDSIADAPALDEDEPVQTGDVE